MKWPWSKYYVDCQTSDDYKEPDPKELTEKEISFVLKSYQSSPIIVGPDDYKMYMDLKGQQGVENITYGSMVYDQINEEMHLYKTGQHKISPSGNEYDCYNCRDRGAFFKEVEGGGMYESILTKCDCGIEAIPKPKAVFKWDDELDQLEHTMSGIDKLIHSTEEEIEVAWNDSTWDEHMSEMKKEFQKKMYEAFVPDYCCDACAGLKTSDEDT